MGCVEPPETVAAANRCDPLNFCGDCTLCCKVFSVTELEKTADVWCVNCNSNHTGCATYEERPKSCVEFECEWFKSQKTKDKMGLNLRPDKCHVVLTNGVAHVDTDYPDAWLQGVIGRKLLKIVQSGQKYAIRIGVKRIGFLNKRAITWISPQ